MQLSPLRLQMFFHHASHLSWQFRPGWPLVSFVNLQVNLTTPHPPQRGKCQWMTTKFGLSSMGHSQGMCQWMAAKRLVCNSRFSTHVVPGLASQVEVEVLVPLPSLLHLPTQLHLLAAQPESDYLHKHKTFMEPTTYCLTNSHRVILKRSENYVKLIFRNFAQKCLIVCPRPWRFIQHVSLHNFF